jgi:hypothetical protein
VTLEHPHITGTTATANQNADEYLIVYTDVEVHDKWHPEYDAKLAAELSNVVKKYIGKELPFEGRFVFKRGAP